MDYNLSSHIPLGFKIKEIREAKGLTLDDVINKLSERGVKISKDTLIMMENSFVAISIMRLKVLCDILDVDLNMLLEK